MLRVCLGRKMPKTQHPSLGEGVHKGEGRLCLGKGVHQGEGGLGLGEPQGQLSNYVLPRLGEEKLRLGKG